MPKAPQEITVNNHLTIEELIYKFRQGTPEYTKIKANLQKAMNRYYNQKGLNKSDNLVEGHHYFTCPITSLRFCEVSNNHFKRFGISKERFVELFPEYDGITETPHASEVRRNKASIKNKTKPKDLMYVGNTQIDLNELKKVITEKATKERFKEIGVAWDDAIEGFHYFVCPITQHRILGFTAPYFKKLESFGLTEDIVRNEYPDVKWLKVTPYGNGITYDDFKHYGINSSMSIREEKIKHIKALDDYATRYNNLSREELFDVISNNSDPIIEDYLQNRNYDLKRFYRMLYEYSGLPFEECIEGYHYIIHPLTKLPCMKYELDLLDIFGISVGRFNELFPHETVRVAPWVTTRIRESSSLVDDNGSTSYGRSAKERANTLNQVDEDGKTGQQRLTEKTRNTHKTTIDEYGRDGYQRVADISRPKSMVSSNAVIRETEFGRYERIVEYILNKVRPYFKSNGLTYGRSTEANLADSNCHQIDHKYSISAGYENKISPLCIGHIDNLQVLTAKENFDKRDSCSITIDDVATMNGMTITEMNDEYERIMAVVKRQISEGEISTSMNTLIEAGHDIAIKVKPYNDFYRQYQYKDNE